MINEHESFISNSDEAHHCYREKKLNEEELKKLKLSPEEKRKQKKIEKQQDYGFVA